MADWRLIPLLQASGEVQMAIDCWLLQQHQAGNLPPILRFYTWSPVAISLGYHQRHYPAVWQHLSWQGKPLDIVRRPTGGRAVLHQGDLTYTMVTSGLSGSRVEVYQQLCQFLIEGWRSLGLELHYGQAGRGYIHNPNCFATATSADLVDTQGNKLVGSAQLRQNKAILQQGSIRLFPDGDLYTRAFNTPAPPAATLPAALQTEKGIDLLIEALTAAASHCLGAEFVTQPFTPSEWQAIA